MIDFILRRPAIFIAVAICSIMSTGLVIAAILTSTIGGDFSVYYRAAIEPSSAAYLPQGLMPFPYAPTMLLWVKPLALLPFWMAFIGWVAVSCLGFIAAFRGKLSKTELVMLVASPPVVACLLTGQVAVMMAALILLACSLPNRWMAGLLFAVVASIKPQLVLLAPIYLLAERDWKAFAAAGFGFLAIAASSVALFGSHLWPEWIASLPRFHNILIAKNVLGVAVTPASVAEHYGLSPSLFNVIGVALGLLVVAKWRGTDELSRCASVCTASLLAAPYALYYDLVPVCPLLVWMTFRNRIGAAVALSSALNPLPLLLTVAALSRLPGQRPATAPSGEAGPCLD